MFLHGHQFVSFGGGFPCHQHLAQKPGAAWLHWNVELLIWCLQPAGKLSECVSCGSVTGPPPGAGGRKEGKWSLIRIFFHTLSANFFHFGFFAGSQGYSNVLEIWNFSTGRERMKYLADAFLRKWQMRESTGGSRGLSVHVTRALRAGCTFAVLVQHFMAINVTESSNNSSWKGIP